MRTLLILACFMLISCGSNGPQSTHTHSSKFKTLDEKIEFLEQYVSFSREYQSLEFDIHFVNGNEGRLPGPTEYSIYLYAKVPENKSSIWVKNLKTTSDPMDVDWSLKLKNSKFDINSFTWYKGEEKIVGINEHHEVLYHIWAE